MFQVNAATVDTQVKGFGHFLNILRTDDTPVTGVTLNADTKEFQDFFAIVRSPE